MLPGTVNFNLAESRQTNTHINRIKNNSNQSDNFCSALRPIEGLYCKNTTKPRLGCPAETDLSIRHRFDTVPVDFDNTSILSLNRHFVVSTSNRRYLVDFWNIPPSIRHPISTNFSISNRHRVIFGSEALPRSVFTPKNFQSGSPLGWVACCLR